MAEICRVLLVTLLLFLYWLPSDIGEGSDVTNSPDNDLRSPPPPLEAQRKGVGDDGDPVYSTGENYIIRLLAAYMFLDCKDTIDVMENGETEKLSYGEIHIIKLLVSYFQSVCKVADVSTTPGPDVIAPPAAHYTDTQNYIIKLITAYASSHCKGAVAAIGPAGAMENSRGEIFIIKLLISFFRSGCKATAAKSGEGVEVGAAGRQLQSVVLELFLLVFGVCFKQVEL